MERLLPLSDTYETSIKQHEKIIAAIEARDVIAAKTEMYNHLEFVKKQFSAGNKKILTPKSNKKESKLNS